MTTPRPVRPEKYQQFNRCTVKEVRTATGQLLRLECDDQDLEMLEKAIRQKVHILNIIETHKTNVGHGGYGSYSRYDIKQHKYGGGRGGFLEVIEIKNPPNGKCGNILHTYSISEGHIFFEFEEISQAQNAYKLWSTFLKDKSKQSGFIRQVRCFFLTPWFYAVANQELIRNDDFVFPDYVQEEGIYQFGKKFIVGVNSSLYEEDWPDIKTCVGIFTHVDEGGSWTYREKTETIYVCFDDGTCYQGNYVRPLRADEAWIDDAIKNFKEMLAGRRKSLKILFDDGTEFVGKVKVAPKSEYKRTYKCVVKCDDGKIREGDFEFQPTDEFPNPKSYILNRKIRGTDHRAVEIIKLTMLNKRDASKWRGVYRNPFEDEEEV